MSARELTDTYQYVVIGYRMQGKHARYEARHLEATGAQAACQKVHAEGLEVVAAIRGTNMTSPVLCSVIHEPSAQPHVAALEALMSIYDYIDDHDNPDKLETGLLEAFRGAVDAVEDYKALIRAATSDRDAS